MTDKAINVALAFLHTLSTEGLGAALREHCAPDCRWWISGMGDAGAIMPKMALMVKHAMDEDGFRMTAKAITADNERVAVEVFGRGRLKSGVLYENDYHFLFVIRDGKISVAKEYTDTAHAQKILGPAFASASEAI